MGVAYIEDERETKLLPGRSRQILRPPSGRFPLPNALMKKNNAILAGVAAVALAAAMAAVTTADENTTDEVQTTVKYKVTEGYSWTVPTSVDFGADATVSKTKVGTIEGNEGKVSVTKNVIEDGKALKITAKGSGANGEFQVANGSTTRGYTIKVGDATDGLAVDGEVLSVPAGTNTGEAALAFTLSTTTGSAEVAGNYTGTVTYTAAIK